MVRKIIPCLWFDGNAEEATNFYVSLFPDAEVLGIEYYGEAGPGQPGAVLTTTFRLKGQEFMTINGGPEFKFTEAVSFYIECESQDEVDELWEKLGEGGEYGPCGWLKDKYGLSWQIIPSLLPELLADEDRERANRVMQAMLQMGKIESAGLLAAYEGA